MTNATQPSTVPADGVEFELTLEDTDPMEMVRSDGYNPKDWKFTGFAVFPQTRCFRLVRVGCCANLNEVREKLTTHGSIFEGQWREAIKKAFPRNDGQGPIGFADPSWVNPNGYAHFPVLLENGKAWFSLFYWTDIVHDVHWRWLV